MKDILAALQIALLVFGVASCSVHYARKADSLLTQKIAEAMEVSHGR